MEEEFQLPVEMKKLQKWYEDFCRDARKTEGFRAKNLYYIRYPAAATKSLRADTPEELFEKYVEARRMHEREERNTKFGL